MLWHVNDALAEITLAARKPDEESVGRPLIRANLASASIPLLPD
jgi:hypothetical protein